MSIHKLPEYVINRLKAGEVVNRPSSVIKELVENSIDAWATKITVEIEDGGKSRISIEDNWSWIELSDMDLLLERYATSKINTEEDLYSLDSYGFRWEALASISEVSKLIVTSKTAYSEIWTKLSKIWEDVKINHLPVSFEHGTVISVEDLFYNVPARLKFLKSSQTEFYYCYNYFVDIAMWHHDKEFVFKKNGKVVFDLPKADGLIQRINDLYKKDYSSNLNTLEYKDEDIEIAWVVSDPSLRFWSAENIKIYVNQRPINDKIIRRALMDAYARQITPWEYPFAVVMLNIRPTMVDVNVHPSKLEVKFVDSRKIYQLIFDTIKKWLWENKIASGGVEWYTTNLDSLAKNFDKPVQSWWNSAWYGHTWESQWPKQNYSANLFGVKDTKTTSFNLSSNSTFDSAYGTQTLENDQMWEHQIVGQLRNSYIVVQSNDGLYYIDQHALAERIAFEKMKKELKTKQTPELLLQPVTMEIWQIANMEEKIEVVNSLWFDCSLLWENKLVIYSVPKAFMEYKIDFESLFNNILYLEEISIDHIFDGMYATKACKTSIKAWAKLSYQQMVNLLQEWFANIDGMFVCQHGRPFFIKVDKDKIDNLFDR